VQCLLPITLLGVIAACATTPSGGSLAQEIAVQRNESTEKFASQPTLRVATLNIAHGRGDSLNQLLVSRQGVQDNLGTIAEFLEARDIHVAALQEVDSPSWWSGSFDHASYLATAAGFGYWAQAAHARLGVAEYGTAVLSRVPIEKALAINFAPSPPTANKGFTLAQIVWQTSESESIVVDVVSIHMDFSRKSVRQAQLEELEKAVDDRNNPIVLMGDFNSEAIARQLMRRDANNPRQLHTAFGTDGKYASYKDKRLDWIIVSGELEIIDYQSDSAVLSDHSAVIATLALKQQ
jgi:endonuclease/exonuclease/phosphatase family metal-dependent hydrolase